MLIKVFPTAPVHDGPAGPVLDRPLLHAWVDTLLSDAISDRPAGVTPAVDPLLGQRWRTDPILAREPHLLEVDATGCGYARSDLLDPLYAWPMWSEVLLPDLLGAGYPLDLLQEVLSPLDYQEARQTSYDPSGVANWIRQGLPRDLLDDVRRFFDPQIGAYLDSWTHLPAGDLEPGWDVRIPARTLVVEER
jgi:hypothetical protein